MTHLVCPECSAKLLVTSEVPRSPGPLPPAPEVLPMIGERILGLLELGKKIPLPGNSWLAYEPDQVRTLDLEDVFRVSRVELLNAVREYFKGTGYVIPKTALFKSLRDLGIREDRVCGAYHFVGFSRVYAVDPRGVEQKRQEAEAVARRKEARERGEV